MADTPRTATPTAHIWLDDQRRAWIDHTNVKVIEVVEDFLAHRDPPEIVHQNYPHLSLAQIHAAMAYYYDHQAQFDAEIEQDLRQYDAARAASMDSPTRKKLRSMGLIP